MTNQVHNPPIKNTKNNPKQFAKTQWYVHRPKHIRDTLDRLLGAESIRKNQQGLSHEHMAFRAANALFHTMERLGPDREEAYHYTLDRKHGAVDRKQDCMKDKRYLGYKEVVDSYRALNEIPKESEVDCITAGRRHAHLSDGNLCYIITWFAFPHQRLIYIEDIEPHENYDFGRVCDPIRYMLESMSAALKANFYDKHKPYNNRIFEKNVNTNCNQEEHTTKLDIQTLSQGNNRI